MCVSVALVVVVDDSAVADGPYDGWDLDHNRSISPTRSRIRSGSSFVCFNVLIWAWYASTGVDTDMPRVKDPRGAWDRAHSDIGDSPPVTYL